MAVTNRSFAVAMLLATLAAPASVTGQEYAGSAESDLNLEVVTLAMRDFKRAQARLSATIDACNRKAATNSVPALKKVELTMLRARREDLRVGLGHLGSHNTFQCERDARVALAFAAGNLEQVMNEMQVPLSENEAAQAASAFPPTEHLRYRAQYARLTPELKHYLETVIGSEPFDLTAALATHGLTEPGAPAVAQTALETPEPTADVAQTSVATAAQ